MHLTTPPPTLRSELSQLIRRARRRQFLLLAFRSLASAAAFFLAGLALLLVSGIPSPAAAWLAALALASAAFGFWRSRPALPSPYLTAQLLDHRLHLHDALSTAVHFAQSSDTSASPAAIAHQRRSAEDAARAADLRYAIPVAAPRALAASAALALLVAALLFIRYGPARLSDLHAPLFQIAFDGVPLLGGPSTRAARKPARSSHPATALPGDVPAPLESAAANYDSAPENALKTVDEPDVDNSSAAPGKPTPGAPNSPSADSHNGRGDASDAEQGPAPGRDGAQPSSAPSTPDSSANPNARKPGSSPSQSSSPSLMERARDAMADLLNKLKPASTSARQSPSQNSSNQARAQRQAGANNSKSASENQQGAPDPNAQGESAAQPAPQQQASSQARASGQNSTRSDSPDAQSGVGSEDGAKQARLAEQLAAMGKISQLIGKRSANVSGDMMVEVSSSTQQLKTQYSNKQAAHTAAGGDIDRDEVPLAYQQYVQQYFEQIRKQPPPKPAPSGAAQ